MRYLALFACLMLFLATFCDKQIAAAWVRNAPEAAPIKILNSSDKDAYPVVETCHDGITYLQFHYGVTVKVDRNGKPITCP